MGTATGPGVSDSNLERQWLTRTPSLAAEGAPRAGDLPYRIRHAGRTLCTIQAPASGGNDPRRLQPGGLLWMWSGACGSAVQRSRATQGCGVLSSVSGMRPNGCGRGATGTARGCPVRVPADARFQTLGSLGAAPRSFSCARWGPLVPLRSWPPVGDRPWPRTSWGSQKGHVIHSQRSGSSRDTILPDSSHGALCPRGRGSPGRDAHLAKIIQPQSTMLFPCTLKALGITALVLSQ